MSNLSKLNYGIIDPFFDDLFNERGYKVNEFMRTDILDLGDSYELKIEVPELTRDDIKISLDDGYLTINASFKENEDDKKNKRYIRKERHYGSFSRSFYVGEAIKEEDVKAKLLDGVLTLNVPKEETVKKVEVKKYVNID